MNARARCLLVATILTLGLVAGPAAPTGARSRGAYDRTPVRDASAGASRTTDGAALALSRTVDSYGSHHVGRPDTDHRDESKERPEAAPRSSHRLTMVGQVGGRTEDVAVQGDYAYVAVGLRVVMLDVSEPVTPTRVGSTTPFPEFVEGVTVSGTLAYVADGIAGLRIMDVSDPSKAVEIGVYDTPGYAEKVAVVGRHAYVADGHYGLRIVDVSDPTDLAEVAYAYPLNYVFDVAVDGQYAYLAAAGAGLLTVDISDPAHPMELGAYDTPGYAYGVDVVGGAAYVGDGWEGMRVFDVSDPRHATEAGKYDTPGWALDVTVLDNTAYVASAFAGLRVLDVSDPAQIVELGSFEEPGAHAEHVAVAPGLVYLADRDRGVQVLDASNASTLTQVGAYSPLVYADAVKVESSYAYVGAAHQGLRIVDITDPASPVEVGAYDTQSYATAVALQGDYAYVATAPGGPRDGLHVVDVSDSSRPFAVGYRPTFTGSFRDMVVNEGIAYVANEWGLESISLANPLSPTLISYVELLDLPSMIVGVDVAGELAYVAEEWAGLKIVDISDPYNASAIAVHDTPGYAENVAVAGEVTCVADGSGLQTVDVSDPGDPVALGDYVTPGWAVNVATGGTIAYVADGGGGLLALDIAIPHTPTLLAAFDTPGYSQEVTVAGDYIYLADGHGGLLILQWSDTPAAPACSSSHLGGLSRGPVEGDCPPLMANAEITGIPRGGSRDRGVEAGGEAARSINQASFPACGAATEAHCPPRPNATAGMGRVMRPSDSDPGTRDSASSTPVALSKETFVVSTTRDAGPGTLRQAMLDASPHDTILFDPSAFPPTTSETIALESPLPDLAHGYLTLDGSNAGVILDGSGLPAGASGLTITSAGNVIRGLQLLRFPENGVLALDGARNNLIGGDRLLGCGPTGQGNLISGNGGRGIYIQGMTAMSNTITGNTIGAEWTGEAALGNHTGVHISGSSHNVLGGKTPGQRNLISGNTVYGIQIGGQGAENNIVIGNFIGTDASGTAPVGNREGVAIGYYARHNRVGGTDPGEGNLISGNRGEGVNIMEVGTHDNWVVGNLVGTDANGAADLGNGATGIAIQMGASGNTIAWNVSSGNGQNGIQSSDWGSDYNTIVGNLVGTDASGTAPVGNDWNGVGLGMWGSSNRVGGTGPDERNVISGNGQAGISLYSMGGVGNLVIGNHIGTDSTGTRSIGNAREGIRLGNGTRRAFVGGTIESQRNVISGNRGPGIALEEAGVEDNFIAGNHIGADATGSVAFGNSEAGIAIRYRAEQNVLQGNLVSGNEWSGVSIRDDGGSNLVRANRIGVAADGSSPMPNGEAGVRIDAGDNVVGGPYPQDGNIIAFNGEIGIQVWNHPRNTIRRNSIHSNTGSGISLVDGGNNGLPAPIITADGASAVTGVACPGCIVELFSDEQDEGHIYEGTTVSDAIGNWIWAGQPTGPFVTATATDIENNTSAFSPPQRVCPHRLYLPLLLKSEVAHSIAAL